MILLALLLGAAPQIETAYASRHADLIAVPGDSLQDVTSAAVAPASSSSSSK